jgi:hypothetical protein
MKISNEENIERHIKYDELNKYFREHNKWKCETKDLSEEDTDFIKIEKSSNNGFTGNIITISLPKKYELGVCISSRIKLRDKINNEISNSTKIEILSYHPIKQMFRTCLLSPFYIVYGHCKYEILYYYDGIPIINHDVQQIYKIVNSNVNIESIEYSGRWNLWSVDSKVLQVHA